MNKLNIISNTNPLKCEGCGLVLRNRTAYHKQKVGIFIHHENKKIRRDFGNNGFPSIGKLLIKVKKFAFKCFKKRLNAGPFCEC